VAHDPPPMRIEPPPVRAAVWLDTFTRRIAVGGVALLLGCALLNFGDIATRRGLALNLVGMVDLTQLLVMACAFLCMPLTFLHEAQVDVDFITARITGRAGAVLRCAGALGCTVFMALVTFAAAQGALQAWQHGDRSSTLAIPLTWHWAPVVFGCALSALACLALSLRHGLAAARPPS
jgi:TRAP-type C4-dicarboxylate transport system permease small subunit